MARKPRRFDLSPDNFLAGIGSDLKADELGLFWLICLRIYSKGGPIAYDEQSFATTLNRTDLRVIKRASARLQQLGKITVTASQVMAKGCATPLEEAANRIATATENGLKGGRPSSENKDISKPGGSGDEKLLPPSPPPPSEESSLRSEATRPKRGVQLPEGFPTVEAMASAMRYWDGKGRRDLSEQCREIAEQFRDHHTSRGTVFKDWDAGWRNWFRNAVKFEKGPQNGRKRTAHDSFAAAAATVASDFSGRNFAEGSDDFRDAGEAGPALLPS